MQGGAVLIRPAPGELIVRLGLSVFRAGGALLLHSGRYTDCTIVQSVMQGQYRSWPGRLRGGGRSCCRGAGRERRRGAGRGRRRGAAECLHLWVLFGTISPDAANRAASGSHEGGAMFTTVDDFSAAILGADPEFYEDAAVMEQLRTIAGCAAPVRYEELTSDDVAAGVYLAYM